MRTPRYVRNLACSNDCHFSAGMGYAAQHKRSHLSLDVQIVALLAASSTAGLSLWAAVFALVFAAI